MDNRNVKVLMTDQSQSYSKIDVSVDYEDDDVIFIEDLRMLPRLYSARLKANVICVCKKGRMEMDVADNHYILEEGEAFVCPSGMMIANPMVSPDFNFTVLCLTDRIIQSLLSTNVDIWNRAVYYRQEHIVKRTANNKNIGHHFMELVHSLIENKDNPFREEMIRTLLQLILLGFCARNKMIEQQVMPEIPVVKSTQSKIIFNKFCELLKSENIKHKPVYYYAERLCISAKYLSHACKEVTGRPANDFIQQAVVDDITHYLRNTTLSVKEIATRLGFPNISFFGKYVKTYFGVSPNEYRKQLYSSKN